MIKVFVLAGNNREFSRYVCDLALKDLESQRPSHTVTRTMAVFKDVKYLFLHNPTQLNGAGDYQIQFIGTWFSRDNLNKMKDIDSANQAAYGRETYFKDRL